MKKLFLDIKTPHETRSVEFNGENLMLGRGDVTVRIDDENLSRRHAEIWRESENFYVADLDSLNGTFLNAQILSNTGKILQHGDLLTLGANEILIRIERDNANAADSGLQSVPVEKQSSDNKLKPFNATFTDNSNKFALKAVLFSVCAILVIFGAVGAVVWKAKSGANITETAEEEAEIFEDSAEGKQEPVKKRSPKQKQAITITPENAQTTPTPAENTPTTTSMLQPETITQTFSKTYIQMSEDEKRKFIEISAEKIARMISSRGGDAMTPEAVAKIKQFVDQYARRLNSPKLGGTCNFPRDDLETLLVRAGKNAPFIIRAFNDEALAPQIGLYLAMIESEHCTCLQSPTGPLGMFQFTRATAQSFGLQVHAGASPSNPDERCQPEPAAKASARYMRFLQGRYGTGPMSVPLGIASYNSGEGGLSKNLETALQEAAGQERSFWTLLLRADALSDQFRKENKNYVPKFFGAAIVGENPTVFGVKSLPLSSINN